MGDGITRGEGELGHEPVDAAARVALERSALVGVVHGAIVEDHDPLPGQLADGLPHRGLRSIAGRAGGPIVGDLGGVQWVELLDEAAVVLLLPDDHGPPRGPLRGLQEIMPKSMSVTPPVARSTRWTLA